MTGAVSLAVGGDGSAEAIDLNETVSAGLASTKSIIGHAVGSCEDAAE